MSKFLHDADDDNDDTTVLAIPPRFSPKTAELKMDPVDRLELTNY